MNKVKNFFDDFTFHARVMPIMVVTMPIVIAAISKGILQGGWSENTGLILLSLVYFTMTSKIARNLGKSYEKKMYQQLGGMPSTIVLRFSNDTFDEVTKKRYHKKLNQFDGLVLPLDANIPFLAGSRRLYILFRTHKAIEIGRPIGCPVSFWSGLSFCSVADCLWRKRKVAALK